MQEASGDRAPAVPGPDGRDASVLGPSAASSAARVQAVAGGEELGKEDRGPGARELVGEAGRLLDVSLRGSGLHVELHDGGGPGSHGRLRPGGKGGRPIV